MPKYDNDAPQKIGYNIIHDMITESKSFRELQTVVEKAIPLMNQYSLDEYQRDKLEQYGIKKFNQLTIEDRQIDQLRKHNRFKKS